MPKFDLTIVLTILLISACTNTGSADSATGSKEKPPLNSPAGIAMNMVADQTGANWSDVEVLSETAVDFGDSSLGCPQPGNSYLQVITPGYKVLAEYDGIIYDVRVAAQRAVICDSRADTGRKL